VAAAIEYGSCLDTQARSVDLGYYNRARLDLDFPFGIDGPLEATADRDDIPVYCPFHRGVLSEDKRSCGYEGPLNRSVEAKGSWDFELSLEANTLFEETGPFAGVLGLSIKPRKSHSLISYLYSYLAIN
jgi:hypothetical protein